MLGLKLNHVSKRGHWWRYMVSWNLVNIDSGNDLVQGNNWKIFDYHTSNISRTLVVNKIVDNSDVVVASPVGAAPTTSSFST